MSEKGNTFLVSGPHEGNDPGYDGIVYVWYIGPKAVEVRFTGTAVEAGPEGLSKRAEHALLSRGESEIEEILNWKVLPDEIEFSTDNYPSILGGEQEGEEFE